MEVEKKIEFFGEETDQQIQARFDKPLDNNGIQRLVVAIIKQAIEDLRLLKRANVIVNGKVSESLPINNRGHLIMPRKVGVEMGLKEARETLEFFKDENIGVLLRLGGIEIEPCRFRAKLQLLN